MRVELKIMLVIMFVLVPGMVLALPFATGTNFGTGVHWSSIALGDIDNDGDLDLIVTGTNDSGKWLDRYINDGTGNFSGTAFGTGVKESSIALGDIDNDGDLDLIVTGYDGSGYRLDKYINDGTGNFGTASPFGTGVYLSSIALGDIDNDGDLDLIVTGYYSYNYYRLDRYINDGTGNFGTASPFGTGVYVSSIALGDIDNDGDLDLIVTGYYNSSGDGRRLDKYINDGAGNFGTESPFGIGVHNSSIALGDIDNDGDLDLIVTGWDGSAKRLDKYINDGTGNFGTASPFGTGVSSSPIALGDIDNDGDLDLIVTGYDGSAERLDRYINDGAGNFSGTAFGTGVYASSIALGDIDNDGDLDLIVTGWDGSARRLDKYINNDTGNFSGTNFGTEVCSSSIALGDIDNDGDLDLIVTGDGDGRRLDKYINDGAGNFSGPTAFGTGVNSSSIALGDIDNDGDLDLIVTGWDGSVRRLDSYTNKGGGTFSTNAAFGTGVGVSSIALGDIDNDTKNDLDLIVTGYDGSTNRLMRYRNLENDANGLPSTPTGMSATNIGDYWRFRWNESTDTPTPANLIRYKVAYGTNSGQYKLSSTNIDYPRGQANLGNVCIVTAEYYQSKIYVGKRVYWKVCAIDSTFKRGAYCAEQVAPNTAPVITNIAASQKQDGSKIVLINYTGIDAQNDKCDYITNNCLYSTNKTSWAVMKRADSGKESFTSSGANLSFEWAAVTNLPGRELASVWVILQVRDIKTNSKPVTNAIPFAVDTLSPRGISCISPANGITNYNTKLELSATAGTDMSTISYYFKVADNENYVNARTSGWRTQPLWTVEELEFDKKYYWSVRAKDYYGNETPYSTNRIFYNKFQPVNFDSYNLQILPNYIGPGEKEEIMIFLGRLDNPEDKYRLIISTVAGKLVQDLGEISYNELNKGRLWKLTNTRGERISTGLYIVLVVGKNKKWTKKFYFRR